MKLRVYILTKDSVYIDVLIDEEEAQAEHVKLITAYPDAMHSIHYKDLELTEAQMISLRAS